MVGRKGIRNLDMGDIHFPRKANRKVEAGEAVALEVARAGEVEEEAQEEEAQKEEAQKEEVVAEVAQVGSDYAEEVVLRPQMTH